MKRLFTSLLMGGALISASAATPAPGTLTVKAVGDNVVLTWEAPALSSLSTITESFEDYEPFVMDQAGEWTFIDGDQKAMQAFFNYYNQSAGATVHDCENWAWQVMKDDDSIIGYPTIIPRTGEKALTTYACYEGSNDDWAISPKLSGKAQTISFYIAQVDGDAAPDPISIYYSTSGKAKEDFTFLKSTAAEGVQWQEVTADLPEGTLYFAIVYTGNFNDDFNYGIRVDDVTYAPAGGESLDLVGYNVYRDDVKLNENPVTETEYTDLNAANANHTYKIACVFSNGEGDAVTIKYKNILPPAPINVSGDVQGSHVVLSWDVPETDPTTVEDFESFEPFNLSDANEWKFIDGDKKEMSAPYDSYESMGKTHDNEPYAWQVINTNVFSDKDFVSAKSGVQTLCTFTVWSGHNDDWAISPLLSGKAQTIQFYAAQFDLTGSSEPLEILYSTTGSAVEDFQPVGDGIRISGEWQKFTATLPEGALYFAFHYTGSSENNYGIKIDDVTYHGEGQIEYGLTGFNVYRDGEKINDEPIEDTQFTDEDMASEKHTYHVSAVYDEGESPKSDSFINLPTSVESVETSFLISVGKGYIKVSGAETTCIFSVSGEKVAEAFGECSVSLNPGVYVIKTDKGTAKAIVR